MILGGNVKKILLENLVQIQSGMLFSKRVEHDLNGNVRVVQLKDVNENAQIRYNDLITVSVDKQLKKHLLKKGDILLKAKSSTRVAAVIDRNIENTIATGHYFVLRIKNSSVLPEYVTWFLNQKPAQRYFDSMASGSTVPIIFKSELEKLEIDIPSLEIQQKIVRIHNLRLREKDLIAELEKKKDYLLRHVLLDTVALTKKALCRNTEPKYFNPVEMRREKR